MARAARVYIDDDPFWRSACDDSFIDRYWLGFWIAPAGEPRPPWTAALRCQFELDVRVAARIHVSGDERYELFLDGKRIGRGPERCDPAHWAFASYDLELGAGPHYGLNHSWDRSWKSPVHCLIPPAEYMPNSGEREKN